MVEVTTLDGIALVLFFYISYHYLSRQSSAQFNSTAQSAQSAQSVQSAQRPLKSIMSAPRDDLAPPKDDPYTPEQLKAYDGADPDKPIYVAIKGTIFDVTHKADVYGAGKSYNIFAGKDASRGLGMSSLEPQNAIPDYSDLNETDMKVLNDWYSFFTQRYNIVGTVVDPATST